MGMRSQAHDRWEPAHVRSNLSRALCSAWHASETIGGLIKATAKLRALLFCLRARRLRRSCLVDACRDKNVAQRQIPFMTRVLEWPAFSPREVQRERPRARPC